MSFLIGRRILYQFNQTYAGWPINIGGLGEQNKKKKQKQIEPLNADVFS